MSCFGAVEYWSIGVLEKAKAQGSTRIGSFITPLLHHSITPALEAPSGGSPGPCHQDPNSLIS